MTQPGGPTPVHEVVEAEGHLIDSHVMEQIFDTVVEYNGRFEVEQFRIGRTNGEPSYLRLSVETAERRIDAAVLLAAAGAGLLAGGYGRRRAARRGARPLRAGGFLFHHQPSHAGAPRRQWIDVENQRMDAMIVVEDGRAAVPPAARSARGRSVVVGMRGIRVVPESKERDRLAFAFMSNGISSERQVETAVRQTAALMRAGARSRAEDRGGGGPGGGAYGRRGRPLSRADPRRLGAMRC